MWNIAAYSVGSGCGDGMVGNLYVNAGVVYTWLPVAMAGLAGHVRVVTAFGADSCLPTVPRIDNRIIR